MKRILKKFLPALLVFTMSLGLSLNAFATGWTTKTAMQEGRALHCTAVYNDQVYVIGGWDTNLNTLNTMEAYNPSTNSWTSKQAMNTARYGAAAATLNGKIYVAGGFNGAHLNTLEEYDPSTNTWTTKQGMDTARSYFGLVAFNNKLYAIGGLTKINNSGVVLGSVEEYNPSTNTWTYKASMIPRYHFGSGLVDNKIYVAGGNNGNNTQSNLLEAYDPSTNTWATKQSMPTARDEFACASLGGYLYALGGYDSSLVTVYNPVTNSWSSALSMDTPRGYLTAATAANKIYAIGGIDSSASVIDVNEEYTP